MTLHFNLAGFIAIPVFACLSFLNVTANAQVATVADAKRVLDLTVFPAVSPNGHIESTVASQSYLAKGAVDDVARKVDAALIKKGLTQLAGAIFMPDYCSVTYSKTGFHFVLTVFPAETDTAHVTLANLGNTDFRKLPIASLGKELFVQPASAVFVCDASVADTQKSCRERLEKDGWEWFGETTASFYMRKNAIRIQIMCSESPNQKGQSMVQVSSEQMSSTLPILPNLVRVDYTEQTSRLDGDSKLSTVELFTQLQTALERNGWNATTKEPLKIDHRETLIFRNANHEMVDLSIHQFEDLSRFEMKYLTAAQVAAENKRAQAAAEMAKAKMTAEQDRLSNPVAIAIELFESAKLKESKPQIVEFTASSGQAQLIVKKWLDKQKAAGWSIVANIDTKQAGDYAMTNGDKKIFVSFVDPGFISAEITIKTEKGFKLEFKK